MKHKTHQEEILHLSEAYIQQSKKYREARKECADNQFLLDLKLSEKGAEIRGERKTLSRENMIVELLRKDEDSKVIYNLILAKEAEYKGLEKVLDALKTKIMALQSVMKYDTKGEYGEHD